MKCGVARIVACGNQATALVLENGEEITANHVLSSIGAVETAGLLPDAQLSALNYQLPLVGRLSFVETMTVFDRQPEALGWGSDTIVFFNDSARFDYARPAEQVDPRSGVI